MNTVRVTTSSAAYDVLVGEHLIAQLGALVAARLARPAKRVFLAHDAGLPRGLIDAASASLRQAGFAPAAAALVSEESRKSLGDLERLLAAIAATRQERFEPVIALGGGIVGDVAGFAAAVYRRGVPVVQCPTTLLSMVDASVGGKTGVNLVAGDGSADSLKKNLVGSFHQPMLVLADVSTLSSLPDRQLRAGLAECIKHGMISGGDAAGAIDRGLFDWSAKNLASILRRDAGTLTELITRNVKVKAAIVSTDEFEELPPAQGGRALLNLGHTFGHAIETIEGLSPDGSPGNAPLHHGEAVAIGLIAASRCAVSAGLCSPALADEAARAVASAGLPTRVRDLPANEVLLAMMSHDKKVVGGKMRLVLPIGDRPGSCRVLEDIDPSHIRAGWDAVR